VIRMECKSYQTQELSFIQKMMQVYWANPKSWLLEEIRFEKGEIAVIRKNGAVFTSLLSNITAVYSTDNYSRREITIISDSDKTRFKEIPGMLTDNEWQEIVNILEPKISKMGMFIEVMRFILKLKYLK